MATYETNTELHRRREFLMAVTFSTLEAVVQARGNGGSTGADPHLLLLLDYSSIAIVLSLASSVLHLVLHCQLQLPLARLFLLPAAFFTAAAVVLLITSSISPNLRWVPFEVFFSTLLFLGCFKLFPAIFHHVAALRCWRSNHGVMNLESDFRNVNPFSVTEFQKWVCGNREARIDVGLSKGCSDGHPEVLKLNGQMTSNPVYKRAADKERVGLAAALLREIPRIGVKA